MFFVLMFLPPASMALTGGPDAGGYEYYDSYEKGVSQFTWNDIQENDIQEKDNSVAVSAFHEEGSILFGPVSMGKDFIFTFYGVPYTEIYISKYGYLTFNDGPPLAFCKIEPIPTEGGSADNFIAGMWAYLHPGT
jgi:hypothetical protein